jgi:cell division protease FtsH
MDKKPFRNNAGGAPKRGFKNFGFIALVVLFGLVFFAAYSQPEELKEIPFSQAITEANEGQYQKIVVKGDTMEITKKGEDEATLTSNKDPEVGLKEEGMDTSKVELVYEDQAGGGSIWLTLFTTLAPVIIISFILFFMLRSAQGQGNQALSFGKSRARLYGNEKDKVTFTNIAGSDEAKQDLQEVVEFLKFPKKFEAVGARIPKGVLLVGPPGQVRQCWHVP